MLYRVMNAVERANGMVYSSLPPPRRKAEDQASYHDKIERQMRHLVAVTQARKTDTAKPKVPLSKNGLNTNHLVKSVALNTQATPTVTKSSDDESILTPQLIQRHCTSIIKSTSLQLAKEQERVELRLNKSLQRLRRRQFSLSHARTRTQLDARLAATTRRPAVGDTPSKEETPRSTAEGTSPTDPLTTSTATPAPPSPRLAKQTSKEILKDQKVSYSLQQHLKALGSIVDDEATCSSSDEEEDIKIEKSKNDRWSRRQASKHLWEQDRSKIGSKWAWLCHQVTSVSQKLYQLDTALQNSSKDPVQFNSHNPFGVPCVCGGRGETAKVGGQNGSVKNERVNGSSSSSPCGCQVRQVLLSNPTVLAQQVQVRDVLGYSFPVLFMDETTQTCARTRELKRAPRRKLVRRKCLRDGASRLDAGYHHYLSQSSDIPCSVLLDTTLHQVLHDHPYASLPLCKRRRPVHNDTSGTTSSISLDRSKSFSPSPAPTLMDTPIDRYRAVPRKRHSNTSSMSEDLGGTPLGLFKKRKDLYNIDDIVIHSIASGTKMEKIEYKEIVTPKWREVGNGSNGPPVCNGVGVVKQEDTGKRKDFRMVAVNHNASCDDIDPKLLEEDMDFSDEAFALRHAKSEENERKRHINYITGGGSHRKRPRLHPQASTPDSSHLPSAECEEWIQQVQPYVQRTFPLAGKDLDNLTNPGPPPEKIIHMVPVYNPTSPHPLSSVATPPHTGVTRMSLDSIAATPLSSPGSLTTPPKEGEECPLTSPNSSQWSVMGDPSQLTVIFKLNKTN